MEGATNNAVDDALTSGCTGAQIDLWLRNRDLLVGSVPSNLENQRTLQSVYLQPLLATLDERNSAPDDSNSTEAHDGRMPDASPIGLFDEDPLQSFTLFLDLRTPMRTAWPVLVAQLRALDQRGYLSYRDSTQELVLRPVTVVVSGTGCRRLSLIDDLSRVIKGSF
jgi:hypothetical protein